jgi:hypothetical protein
MGMCSPDNPQAIAKSQRKIRRKRLNIPPQDFHLAAGGSFNFSNLKVKTQSVA